MRRKVVTVDANATITRAADMMQKYNVGCVVVTDKQKAVGIILEDAPKGVAWKRRS